MSKQSKNAAATGTVTTPVGTMATAGDVAAMPPPVTGAASGQPTEADPQAAAKVAGAREKAKGKARVATIWLEGCSGCHMSFLDMDERLLDLAALVDVVYSPLVDYKEYPDDVDVCLIEGAVATDEDIEKLKKIRRKTKLMIALGDCAVTGNVPAMRNNIKVDDVFDRAYRENAQLQQQRPTYKLPVLMDHVRPVHELVKVDVHIPGCPPPADAIFYVLTELLAGRTPDVASVTRFGK